MTLLSNISLPAENGRLTAGLFLVSGLAAQIALLLTFSAEETPVQAITSILLLFIALAAGYLAARWAVLSRRSRREKIYTGFLINAGGLLLLLLAAQGALHGLSLLPGVMVCGLGQGSVIRAIKGEGERFRPHFSPFVTGLGVLVALIAVGICLATAAHFADTSGYPYAFASLLDLSLLAALHAKITQREG